MSDPQVICEDENFLALNKPAGLLMHPFRVGTDNGKIKIKQPTLADWILAHYPETGKAGDNPEMRPGMVHRLDRETSGIVLVARNQDYFEYLKSLFKSRSVRKTYWALTAGKIIPGEGVIDKPIGLIGGTTRRTIIITKNRKLIKEAITEYRARKYLEDRSGNIFSEVDVFPRTGRTHQIRVHLASMRCPIVGDPMYGRATLEWNTRLMLHARALEFSPYPDKRLKLEAELPKECVLFRDKLTLADDLSIDR